MDVTNTSTKEKGDPKKSDVTDEYSEANVSDQLAKKLLDEEKGACASGEHVNSDFEYVVIDNEDKLKESIKDIQEMLREDSTLAVDCEGDNLSRKGTIQLISIATTTKTFLIDILELKASPFELGLRDILEKEGVKKLMFDCREDADALFHQFQVNLCGVIDIQLLEVIKRPAELTVQKSGRRSTRQDEVVSLKGLLTCVQEFIQDKGILELKQKASNKMSDWGKRPIEKELLEYATVDVRSLFLLFDKLHPDDEEMGRLEIASRIYVDLKRSIPVRQYDRYEKNGYLPIDVIPEKGRRDFDYGYMSCTKCKRRFPGEEFSKTQLKNGNQLCRTCKKVKLDIDVHESRMRNYELNEMRREEYDYYDSDFDYGYGFGFGCGYDSDCYNYDSD